MPLDTSTSESERTRKLREARDVLARGYCRGVRSDGRGNHCALGAIDTAYKCWDRADLSNPAIELLGEFCTYRGVDEFNHDIVRDESHPIVKIAGHNNMTNKKSMLQAFDKAIEKSMQLDVEALVNV